MGAVVVTRLGWRRQVELSAEDLKQLIEATKTKLG